MNVLDLFDLRGKRALVTGASSGIGKKVAQAYLQAGADVAIAARNFEALQNIADELAADGPPGTEGNVVPIRCDVTRPEQVSAMLDRAVAELGGIDIAVCNAASS
jgi:NAD(P)-dependent dehydrogenase (short-subunit alcohol dehydrogenase family)